MPIEIIADFNQDNLRLYKRGLGIIFNEEIDKDLRKKLKRVLTDQEQKKIVVVGAPGETEELTFEKNIAKDVALRIVNPTVTN